MPKITFIGAGSWGFTRGLVRDLLPSPLTNATITLMDIDPERLEFAKQACQRIVELGKYPAKVEATTNRAEALTGADYVVVTILASPFSVWRKDLEIPMKYGVDTNIGDTRGPSGIFRGLRTIPVMVDIAKDMEKYCPNAVMLNYTNPMVLLCRAMQHETKIKLVGLCHSVQGTAEMLARWIGAPMEEITYTCAGINHMAFYLDYKWTGQDAYPLIHKAITERPEVYNEEQVRNEMYLALDYYVTESSGHGSEYNWWFRKRPDLIEKFCTHGTGWNPARISTSSSATKNVPRPGATKPKSGSPLMRRSLSIAHEYAAYIMNALEGGEPFEFNGNLKIVATSTICRRVPVSKCQSDKQKGFEPVRVGNLPASVAMLTGLTSQLEEMTVEGCLTGNPRLIYQAICHDPLTASVCSLQEIKTMVNEMFAANVDYLPTFKHFMCRNAVSTTHNPSYVQDDRFG